MQVLGVMQKIVQNIKLYNNAIIIFKKMSPIQYRAHHCQNKLNTCLYF
ncbi:hypothetical protein C8C85_0753 [Flavobacterium sp. 103]|nr:hypothetical protein C8C85_0753 [Flavobacterium sp. 103]